MGCCGSNKVHDIVDVDEQDNYREEFIPDIAPDISRMSESTIVQQSIIRRPMTINNIYNQVTIIGGGLSSNGMELSDEIVEIQQSTDQEQFPDVSFAAAEEQALANQAYRSSIVGITAGISGLKIDDKLPTEDITVVGGEISSSGMVLSDEIVGIQQSTEQERFLDVSFAAAEEQALANQTYRNSVVGITAGISDLKIDDKLPTEYITVVDGGISSGGMVLSDEIVGIQQSTEQERFPDVSFAAAEEHALSNQTYRSGVVDITAGISSLKIDDKLPTEYTFNREISSLAGVLNECEKAQSEISKLKLFMEWNEQTKMLMGKFLVEYRRLMEHKLLFKNLKIMISYVDEGDKTRQNIFMLELVFRNLGIGINCINYSDRTELQQQLNDHTHAIILATPVYQKAVAPDDDASKVVKKMFNKFGEIEESIKEEQDNKAKLHVLLCDGSYDLVTSKIVDQKYLIRPYQTVFNEEKIWYQLDYLDSFENLKEEKLEDWKIYITKNKDCTKKEGCCLKYRVKNLLNPDKPVENGEIHYSELFGEGSEPNKLLLEEIREEELLKAISELNLKKINQILPKILEITASKGITLKESIADFQEQLPLLDFIEHFFNPLSYKYGLGILPSILGITETTKVEMYEKYKDWFKSLKIEQHRLNIKYRLNKILLKSIEKDGDALAATKLEKLKPEDLEKDIKGKIIEIIDRLEDSTLKSSLVLCQNGLDQVLINMLLKRQLMQKANTIIISIDCGRKYKGDKTLACEVEEFLKEKLYLSMHEVEELAKQDKEQVIILFENYEKLNTYENLYVKNKLSKWRNVKMLVTCDREFFQHRGYTSCILPDPGFMDLDVICCKEIDRVFSNFSTKVSLRKSSIVDRNRVIGYSFDEAWRKETKFIRAKRYAQQAELHKFLSNIHNAFEEKINGIKKKEQIFISYAWEASLEMMQKQRSLLSQIVIDLQILGFFVWLDIERSTSNIDQQLAKNIAKSKKAFIIGTPLYKEKAADSERYVAKEFKIIMDKSLTDKEFKVFPIKFSKEEEQSLFPKELMNSKDELMNNKAKKNLVDFCGIDDEEEYIRQLTNPSGLVAKLLDLELNQALKAEYDKYYEQLQQRLRLLPASHLLVNKGQKDVQAYDIDGRLEVYIEPFGQSVDPNKTADIVSKVCLGKDFSDFLEDKRCKTYVALGEAGSGKTLFTLWTFKQYILQPWHSYRNRELKVYLCSQKPEEDKIDINAIYLFLTNSELSDQKYMQYACIVKNYKHDKEMQIVTINESNLEIYQRVKNQLEIVTKEETIKEPLNFSGDDKIEFFDILKPKWLPIYIPLKNYPYPGKGREKNNPMTPLQYIEEILLTDYYLSSKDLFDLKIGLGFKQNVLFILDGYDELIKGNNPNFTQALLGGNGYKGLYLCRKKPNELEEDFIYIYIDNNYHELRFLFKTENEGKIKIVDNEIYKDSKELLSAIQLEMRKLSYSDSDLTNNAELINKFFAYTAKNHYYDSYEIDYKSKLSETNPPQENVLYLEQIDGDKISYVCLSDEGKKVEGTINFKNEDLNNVTLELSKKTAKLEKMKSNPTKELLDDYKATEEEIKQLEAKKTYILDKVATSEIIESIEKKQQVLKIFLEKHPNISRNFKFHNLRRWQHAKVFITGRPEHFDNDAQHIQAFSLNDSPDSYKVKYMAKFTEKEIEKYITDYQKADREQARQLGGLVKKQTIEDITKGIIEKINNLGKEVSELITNPFLLNITLQALPGLRSEQISENSAISRASLYEGFIKYWYTKEMARKEKSTSEILLSQSGCYEFVQELVMQMFIHKTISISEKIPELWEFFNNPESTFARETCPLRRSGNEYSFIHKSVYEYLLARYLMTASWPEVQKLTSAIQLAINGFERNYNNSTARLLKEEPSVFSFIQDFARLHISDKPHLTNLPTPENQPENLYNIFLELLSWNEDKLALTLITDEKPQEVKALDQELKELTQMFKQLLLTDNNKAETASLTAAYHAWNPPPQYPTVIEKPPIFISWRPQHTSRIRISLNTEIIRFLNLVGLGEQDQAEKLLKHNPELAAQKGNLTDCSGRTWSDITGFQYAVLALDYHMWNMIKKYLDKINLNLARVQIQELEQIATLTDNGWIIKESASSWPNISLLPLIQTLDTYIKNYDAWSGEQCGTHWRQQVGGAQLILPAHVINEYSHPSRPLYPCPKWNTDDDTVLPRTGVSDWRTGGYGNQLGNSFAWVRGDWRGRLDWDGHGNIYTDYAKQDRAAMAELLKSRTKQAQVLRNIITVLPGTPSSGPSPMKGY
jgi:hypothetical protein